MLTDYEDKQLRAARHNLGLERARYRRSKRAESDKGSGRQVPKGSMVRGLAHRLRERLLQAFFSVWR